MNRDEQFEKLLRRRPVKPVPPAWRAEILSVAERATATSQAAYLTRYRVISALRQSLSSLLWPQPRAWAALGTVWVLILLMNLLAHDQSAPTFAHRVPALTPAAESELKQQERMFAELVGLTETPESEGVESVVPRPRSQRRSEFMEA